MGHDGGRTKASSTVTTIFFLTVVEDEGVQPKIHISSCKSTFSSPPLSWKRPPYLVELLKRAPLPLQVLVRRVLVARDSTQHRAHAVLGRLLRDGSAVVPPVARGHRVGHGVRGRRAVRAAALGAVRHPRAGRDVLLPRR